MATSSAVEDFRAFEFSAWKRVAVDYIHHWSHLTIQTAPHLLDAVKASEGVTLVDVACGAGDVTAFAARSGLRAIGVDFCAEMTAFASARHQGVEFITGDAEDLPFVDQSVDMMVMNFGMLHLARPELAIAEAARVLRPGGRFAFTVWANPDSARGLHIAIDAVDKYSRVAVTLPKGPDFFAFSDPDNTERSLSSAGFVDIKTTAIPMTWEHSSPSDVFHAFLLGSARSGAAMQLQDETSLIDIANEIEAQSRNFFTPDGRVAIPMSAVLSSARLP